LGDPLLNLRQESLLIFNPGLAPGLRFGPGLAHHSLAVMQGPGQKIELHQSFLREAHTRLQGGRQLVLASDCLR